MKDLILELRGALKEMLGAFETVYDGAAKEGEMNACHRAKKAIERIDMVRHCCEIDCENSATVHIEYSNKSEDSSDFCDYCLISNLPNGRASHISPITN